MVAYSIRLVFLIAAISAFATPDSAAAQPNAGTARVTKTPPRSDDVVIVAPSRRSDARAAKVIFLNRCAGGCAITTSGNNAKTDTSTIVKKAGILTEFAHSEETWQRMLTCVRDVYAPFAVEVVDAEPASTTNYVEVVVAGTPATLGLDQNTLGIAPLTSDCSPQKNVLAFAFAAAHPKNAAVDLCATVAHEAGHVFGLDHAFECRDPMTYLTGCGTKYFLHLDLPCGEFESTRPCRCGTTQNSHRKLMTNLGAGSLPTPPSVSIVVPATRTAVTRNFAVISQIAEKRWLARVELWINGWLWATARPGAATSPVTLNPPRNLPDGKQEIEIRAYDDLGQQGAARIEVTQGPPCVSAATCLNGQVCTDGACRFPTPSRALGDACTTNSECPSHLCQATADTGKFCSEICAVDTTDNACEAVGLSCQASGEGYGVCLPVGSAETGGCCRTGRPESSIAGFALIVIFMVTRRRRLPITRKPCR